MSAPHTDPETEAKKSKWPLIGMAVVVLVVMVAFSVWLLVVAADAPGPVEPSEAEGIVPLSQEGSGSVPAPAGVEPQVVEPAIINPTLDE